MVVVAVRVDRAGAGSVVRAALVLVALVPEAGAERRVVPSRLGRDRDEVPRLVAAGQRAAGFKT